MLKKKMYNTKTEMVYEKLKVDIVAGLLKQGEKIVAREVAVELGVSDIPVREALKKLESEGLVENIPHVGSRVSQINLQKAEEIFAIRLELESFAVRLAAENAKPEELKELQKLVDEMEDILQGEKELESVEIKNLSLLNTEFHNMLYQLSGNETLCEMIYSLKERSQYSQSVFMYLPERQKLSNKEHQLIVDALRIGDAMNAEKTLREQKAHAFEGFLNKIRLECKED
ncbi:GntR family transcriptional regulator [Neobacillus vireti]|uniref:GntR family transcriptional regulator n=1 Tax=Neobacillus vireti TaxID=220686 RepID=UPI00300015B4